MLMSLFLCRISGTLVGSAALNALKGIVTSEAQTRFAVHLQKLAISNVLRQEMAWFDCQSTGAIFTQLGSVGSIRSLLSDLIPTVISTGVNCMPVCPGTLSPRPAQAMAFFKLRRKRGWPKFH